MSVRVIQVILRAKLLLRVGILFTEVAKYEAVGVDVIRCEGLDAVQLGYRESSDA